jgi:hypothetical protein
VFTVTVAVTLEESHVHSAKYFVVVEGVTDMLVN